MDVNDDLLPWANLTLPSTPPPDYSSPSGSPTTGASSNVVVGPSESHMPPASSSSATDPPFTSPIVSSAAANAPPGLSVSPSGKVILTPPAPSPPPTPIDENSVPPSSSRTASGPAPSQTTALPMAPPPAFLASVNTTLPSLPAYPPPATTLSPVLQHMSSETRLAISILICRSLSVLCLPVSYLHGSKYPAAQVFILILVIVTGACLIRSLVVVDRVQSTFRRWLMMPTKRALFIWLLVMYVVLHFVTPG